MSKKKRKQKRRGDPYNGRANLAGLLSPPEEKKIEDVPNLICEFFTKEQLKWIFYHMCRVDIADNNDKAEMLKMYLPSDSFIELGTGTNRIAFLHNGFCVKIALDRRGLVDNMTEYKRSFELPMYLARTYETNYLINITEYVTLLDRSDFMMNEPTIKTVLADLAMGYIFADIGFMAKNYCNWGYRTNPEDPEETSIVVLDYGYLYPIRGDQKKSELFRCPKCGASITWNGTYTGFVCKNHGCNAQYTPTEIRRRMSLDLELVEDQMLGVLNGLEVPDLNKIEEEIADIRPE